MLILPPALKRWGPPRQLGLCMGYVWGYELHFFDTPFLSGTQELRFYLRALGLGIPKGWLSLWFLEPIAHKPSGGSHEFFFGCLPHPNASIVNADRTVRVIQSPGDDLEGVIEVLCPPVPPPPQAPKFRVEFRRLRGVQAIPTLLKGEAAKTQESVQTTPTPLKGTDASSEQSMEDPELRVQPSIANPATEEDTRPKVLIRGEWRKVLDSYSQDASY